MLSLFLRNMLFFVAGEVGWLLGGGWGSFLLVGLAGVHAAAQQDSSVGSRDAEAGRVLASNDLQ